MNGDDSTSESQGDSLSGNEFSTDDDTSAERDHPQDAGGFPQKAPGADSAV